MSTNTHFYVQMPCDEYWNVYFSNFVIEAGSVDVSEIGLYDWQKTDRYVRDNLKVISQNMRSAWPYVSKNRWVKCEGPARTLSFREYVALYHAMDPQHPLPKGWCKK